MYVFFDGEILEAEQVKLDLTNRSFRYGDGIFETIRMFNYEMPFLDKHLERLRNGLAVLHLSVEIDFFENIKQQLINLAKKNKTPNARLRLMVFRKGGGLYAPETNASVVFIESKSLDADSFVWNDKGLKIGFYEDMKIQPSIISPYKSNNCLPYILAAIYQKNNELDECILFNESGNVADCIYSNLFIVKDNKIFTPEIGDGGVAGTMRASIIEILKKQNQEVQIKSINKKDLLEADEIFLTNAIRGVQPVRSLLEKEYFNRVARKVYNFVGLYLSNDEITSAI